jgi:hypothetical protein
MIRRLWNRPTLTGAPVPYGSGSPNAHLGTPRGFPPETGPPFSMFAFGQSLPQRNLSRFNALIALLFLAFPIAANASDIQKWTGSRTTPVHQIPLKDASGLQIVPTESHPLPFSARTTCAPCHEYAAIEGGLHFSAQKSGSLGRPGEPWFWVDERTGTQLPLSYRPSPGVWNPGAVGLTNWDFTLLFGRHLPGGDAAEPPDSEMTPGSRWEVSGKVEINCLGCHNASRVQNPSEWAKQIMRENFRWAATAAAGLGEVGGMAARLKPTWDVYDGPNPDDSEWAVAPFVKYNPFRFQTPRLSRPLLPAGRCALPRLPRDRPGEDEEIRLRRRCPFGGGDRLRGLPPQRPQPQYDPRIRGREHRQSRPALR